MCFEVSVSNYVKVNRESCNKYGYLKDIVKPNRLCKGDIFI